jgi:Rrf2 family protein
MFAISARVDYGLLILVELMHSGVGKYHSLADIAHKHQMSPKFLSQVVMPLKQAGLVISREGKTGGYTLARDPETISLRTIVEAMDGPIQLTRCMDGNKSCPADSSCTTKPVWSKLNESLYLLLEQQTLADLSSKSL